MTVLVRVGALALAIALVVGAVLVRSSRDAGTPVDVVDDGAVAVGCATELRNLCQDVAEPDQVAWETARARDLATSLEGTEPAVALLPAAWADVADDARARAGRPPLVRSEVLGHTPLLVIGFQDRMDVLAEACEVDVDEVGWVCIGEHAGSAWTSLGGDVRWGPVVTGHLPPDTGTGLQATAAVVAARTGTPFSLADLRDVGFTTWFGRVERSVRSFRPAGGSHLTAMLTRGPSSANVAMVTEAELVTRGLDTSFGRLVAARPDPLAVVELVVVGTDEDLVGRVAGRLDTGAVAAAGWRVGEEVPVEAPFPELGEVVDPPSGGVLTAVVTTWQDVAG